MEIVCLKPLSRPLRSTTIVAAIRRAVVALTNQIHPREEEKVQLQMLAHVWIFKKMI